jgi:hypothetical protein
MWVRSAVALLTIAASVPAVAEPLNAEAARHFVAGKLFSFTCFEGSTGSGRIFHDGSVLGMVRMQGAGPARFMRLPAGTLFPKGGAICSSMKGAFFNPCFDLSKTGANSFRGAISGFGFAYCDFTRGGGTRDMIAAVGRAGATDVGRTATTEKTEGAPRSIRRRVAKPASPETTASTAPPAPVAAPTTPVSSAPLPSVEQSGMRSSIPQ